MPNNLPKTTPVVVPPRRDTTGRAIEDLAVITKNGFDEMDKKFTGKFNGIDKRFEMVDRRLDKIEATVNRLPDKGYLSDKMADLEGVVVVRQRKEDRKVNLLVEFLQKKKILEKEEVKMLREIQVFPSVD